MIASANVSPSAIDAAVGDTNKTKGGRRVNEILQTAMAAELGITPSLWDEAPIRGPDR